MKLTGKKDKFFDALEVKCSCGNVFSVLPCKPMARCVNCGSEKEMAALCKAFMQKDCKMEK